MIETLGLLVLILAAILTLTGYVWSVVEAWRVSAGLGLLVLLNPLATLSLIGVALGRGRRSLYPPLGVLVVGLLLAPVGLLLK